MHTRVTDSTCFHKRVEPTSRPAACSQSLFVLLESFEADTRCGAVWQHLEIEKKKSVVPCGNILKSLNTGSGFPQSVIINVFSTFQYGFVADADDILTVVRRSKR